MAARPGLESSSAFTDRMTSRKPPIFSEPEGREGHAWGCLAWPWPISLGASRHCLARLTGPQSTPHPLPHLPPPFLARTFVLEISSAMPSSLSSLRGVHSLFPFNGHSRLEQMNSTHPRLQVTEVSLLFSEQYRAGAPGARAALLCRLGDPASFCPWLHHPASLCVQMLEKDTPAS